MEQVGAALHQDHHVSGAQRAHRAVFAGDGLFLVHHAPDRARHLPCQQRGGIVGGLHIDGVVPIGIVITVGLFDQRPEVDPAGRSDLNAL